MYHGAVLTWRAAKNTTTALNELSRVSRVSRVGEYICGAAGGNINPFIKTTDSNYRIKEPKSEILQNIFAVFAGLP